MHRGMRRPICLRVRDALRESAQLETLLMDTAGGIGELQEWALARADQAVVLCPPDYLAANNIAKVLSDDELKLPERTHARAQRHPPRRRRRPRRDRAPLRPPQLRRTHPRPLRHQLRLSLDQATYTLAALPRSTRLPLKRLAATIGEGLR
jgi:hypothetical protein